jgi:hypothetical protein
MSADDLDTTAIRRMNRDDLESTGMRKALAESAQVNGFESAEAVYRAVASLRDLLPADAQKQVAVCFEWAREGIARQTADTVSPELEALHAAYGYARDVMLAAARKNGA